MVEVNPRGVVTGCGAVGGAAADLASALLGSDAGGACLPRVSSALSGTDGETASGCSRYTLSTRVDVSTTVAATANEGAQRLTNECSRAARRDAARIAWSICRPGSGQAPSR